MLYIVATPIGNLKEITYRAVEILKTVEYILCEDTRTSLALLNAYEINKPLKSYHKFNETKVSSSIIDDLKEGKDIALISDAGMPGISDPGNILINECIKNNIEYTVVSGASALINAFVLSGFSAPFTFFGFLPDNSKKRLLALDIASKTNSTLIFYCSPHSINDELKDLYNRLGDQKICVVREISKKFESIEFSTLAEGYKGLIKGEFVVLIENVIKETNEDINVDKDLETLISMGLTKPEACKVLAKAKGLKKSDLYNLTIDK